MTHHMGGMIGYFNLQDWWFTAFTDTERQIIEASYGNNLTQGNISSTSQTVFDLLRAMARFWQPSPEQATLASKLRAWANKFQTGKYYDDFWTSRIDDVTDLWHKKSYDDARLTLHALAYKVTYENAPPPIPDLLNDLMASFIRDDPYYADVINAALPLISNQPGIIQSQLLKKFPQFDAERFRYAMYYGMMLGDVVRKKNGKSYSLYTPENFIAGDKN